MNLAFLPLTFQFLLFGSRGNGRPDTSWLGPFLEYDLMVMATGRGKRFWILQAVIILLDVKLSCA